MFRRKSLSGLLIICILITGFWGCRSKREAAAPEVPVDEEIFKPEMKAFIEAFRANQADFQWFSARFSGSVLWQNQTQAVGGSIRIQKDKAIYISVAPVLGIEVARLLITPDSLKMVNRIEGSYYTGSIDFLNRMLHTDIDFFMLQALFVGNDFPHFRSDRFVMENRANMLSLTDKNRRRSSGPGGTVNQQIIVDPETMKIRINTIEDTRSNRILKAEYRRLEEVDQQLMPSLFEILFTDGTHVANLNLSYNRMSIDEPQRMNFSIPSRYTPITLD